MAVNKKKSFTEMFSRVRVFESFLHIVSLIFFYFFGTNSGTFEIFLALGSSLDTAIDISLRKSKPQTLYFHNVEIDLLYSIKIIQELLKNKGH